MDLTDIIIKQLIRIFGKNFVWGLFNVIDFFAGINTQLKLLEVLIDLKQTCEDEIKLYTAEGEELEILIQDEIEKSKKTIKLIEDLESRDNLSFSGGVALGVLKANPREIYNHKMYEIEKKEFSLETSNKVLLALEQVIAEAKQGKFKHSLSQAMKRLEELTDFEMFEINNFYEE